MDVDLKLLSEQGFFEGAIVPYRNTHSRIVQARITSFKVIDSGKIWFYGIDTVTNAQVYYPVHLSKKLRDNDQ